MLKLLNANTIEDDEFENEADAVEVNKSADALEDDELKDSADLDRRPSTPWRDSSQRMP